MSVDLLDPGGPIARAMAGFESRASQAEMMDLVGAAFRDDGVLCVEAGTGTGKTLAYLIPAVRWAAETGEKVVISTHTIALQEQILEKDLPLVSTALGIPIEAVLVKGRNNYLCRRKVAESLAAGRRLIDPDENAHGAEELARIAAWIEENEEGSRSELGFTPAAELWEAVKSDRDSCLRTRCPHHARCYYYKMRRAAARANLLIANHHLVFADLALRAQLEPPPAMAGASASGGGRGEGPGERGDGVLPAYGRLILDEGHHVEDIASAYFGAEVSRAGVLRTLSRLTGSDRRGNVAGGLLPSLARELLARTPAIDPEFRAAYLAGADRIERRLAPFGRGLSDMAGSAFAEVQAWVRARPPDGHEGGARQPRDDDLRNERKIRLRDEPDEFWRMRVVPALGRLTDPPDGLLGLADELRLLRKELITGDDETDGPIAGPLVDLMGLVSALERAAASIDLVALGEGPGVTPAHESYVRWVESGSKGPAVRMVAAPIELGGLLERHLFQAKKTVVLTSATLTAGGAFEYLAGRIGMAGLVEGRAVMRSFESPFDWERQAMVVVPTDLPAPDEAGHDDALAERVLEGIQVTDGGAFVLFTSHRALNRVHDALVGRLAASGLVVLRQGDAERNELLRRFREDASAVLFATESFWEGVDVSGAALRNVIITRLPFRVPTEPVLAARAERIAARGGDPFSELSVPQALLKFRQGVGRLVRTRTDRGILVVLDKRVVSRRYGRRFLEALPPCRLERGDSAEVFAVAKAFLSRTTW